ncbi:EamA family transporter, partial [Streptomyces minutiscleroticus]
MSVNPVLAAVVGWLGLGQGLDRTEWSAIGAIVAANAVAVLARPAPPAPQARSPRPAADS